MEEDVRSSGSWAQLGEAGMVGRSELGRMTDKKCERASCGE